MMKLAQSAFIATAIVGVADAINVRGIFNRHKDAEAAASESTSEEEAHRELGHTNCWGADPDPAWHPVYSAGWTNGYCRFTVDCNSPAYSSELACCKGAYTGQISGYCLSQLPQPPTQSPTDTGGLDVYYPDYATPWNDAGCINARPLPSGRPTYSTMLACCKGAYAGQMSGKCLSMLPSPPTSSPTMSGGLTDYWWPDYDTPWADAGCKNTIPTTFNKNDRPSYATQLACCKGAYAGQMSGKCLSQLPNPPTLSPTGAGGLDYWYPDYDTPWDRATCKNDRPLPFLPGGRPTYDTQLACCKGAYGGQISGACVAALPNPPTSSPTPAGGADFWYPDYENNNWATAYCKNDLPLPFRIGDRPTFDTQQACCDKSYGGQTSHKCDCVVDPCSHCECASDKAGLIANGCSATFVYQCYPTPAPTSPPTNQPTQSPVP